MKHRIACARKSLLILWVVMGVLSGALANAATLHLTDAQTLVSNLQISKKNVYGSNPSYILWNGTASEARTVCATFATLLLKRTYSYTDTYFSNWFGSSSPNAADYHDTIKLQKGFQRITNVSQIQPGDFLAIKYYDPNATSTGHVMLAASVATSRVATSPIVTGTTQYQITVIDSSQSYHGSTDTRYPSGQGIGQGVFRIYTDAAGTIVGYTWSLFSDSLFYTPDVRDLVVGRINK